MLAAQHGQAVEGNTLGGASCVVVNGIERQAGCRGAGGHGHNQRQAICWGRRPRQVCNLRGTNRTAEDNFRNITVYAFGEKHEITAG